MDPAQLAEDMATGMGFPLPASTELEGFAQGLIDGLKAGTATTGPATGNTISGLDGSSIASDIEAAAGYPSVSAELQAFGDAFKSYIEANAIVTYTGPGPSFSTGGTISGLVGSDFADEIQGEAGYPSVSSELLAFAVAVTDHITNNAEVENGVIT